MFQSSLTFTVNWLMRKSAITLFAESLGLHISHITAHIMMMLLCSFLCKSINMEQNVIEAGC